MRTIEQQMKIDHERRVSQLASIPDLKAEIARLQEQVETLRKELRLVVGQRDFFMKINENNSHRAEAAEAERDRLQAAVADVVEVSKSGADTVSFLIELNRVARNCAAALQKEPQP